MRGMSLPYGDTTITLPDLRASRVDILEPTPCPGVPDERAALAAALAAPVNTAPIRELAKGKSSAVITVSDVTRVSKSQLLVPLMLEELAAAGIPARNVTVLFAVGGHRLLTPEEQAFLIGEAAASGVTMVNHNSRDDSALVYAGQTRAGTPVWINKLFVAAPLRIVTGAANYHDFAGFSGGPKGVLPGVAGQRSINANHVRMFSPEPGGGFHPKAMNGETTANPTWSDMAEAAHKVEPDFLVNVALNANQELVAVGAGTLIAGHAAACDAIKRMFRVPATQQADVVIGSPGGYPKDIDFYQGLKTLINVQRLVRPGGAVVLLAECREGLGAPSLGEWLSRGDASVVERDVKADFSIIGKIAYQIHTWVQRHRIIMVTDMDDPVLSDTGIVYARSLDGALGLAYGTVHTETPSIAVVPAGNITFCDVGSLA